MTRRPWARRPGGSPPAAGRPRTRPTTRRSLIRAAGTTIATGVLAGVAGCGAVDGGATDPDGPTPTAPARPRGYAPLGRVAVPGATEAVVFDDGDAVAVATGDGIATVDVSNPADPRVLAERRGLLADRPGGPLGEIQDVTVAGDRLLAVGPANPLPADRDPALHAAILFDVADPADPTLLAVTETEHPIHNAELVGPDAAGIDTGAADGRHVAFLTGHGQRGPMVVLDPASGERLGEWSVVDAGAGWSAVHPSLRQAHDVTVRGDCAAVAYWDAGTWLLDVADPTAPAPIGHVATQSPEDLATVPDDELRGHAMELPGNSHYALLSPDGDLLAVGREAWDADGDGEGAPGGIDLYRVADVTVAGAGGAGGGGGAERPEPVGHVPPLATPDPSPAGPWTTAHNVAFRGDRLYASWYHGGVSVHDVSVPAHPVTLARWRDPARAAFWTAVPATDCFVAPSTSYLEGTEGAIYTFPDEPGRQTDPPPLSAARTTTTE